MRCEDARIRIEEARLGLLTGSEREAFDAHVASCERCRRETREVEEFESLLGHARDRERDAALVAALGEHQRGRRRRGRLIRSLAGAAAVLLVVTVILAVSGHDRLPSGEVITLADGATGHLREAEVRAVGSCRLRITDDGRRVDLLAGAAHFDVAPGHGPFVVETPVGRIDVKGTSFEVRIMSKRTLAAAAIVVAVAVTTGVVMFSDPSGETTVEAQEILVTTPGGAARVFGPRDVANLLEKLDRLESENEELRRAASMPTEETSPETASERPDKPEPAVVEPVATPERPASIAKTDWDRMGTIVADLVAADQRGENSNSSPALMLKMAYLLTRIRAIAKELEIADPNEVFYHPRVATQFFPGMVKALLPDLDQESQDGLAAELLEVLALERARWTHPMLATEKRARDLELAVRIADQAASRLDREQLLKLLGVLATGRPGGYSVSGFGQTSLEKLKDTMGRTLAANARLTGAAAEEAHRLGGEFVERHLAVRAELERAHGVEIVGAALWGNREQEKPVATANPDFPINRVRIRAALIRVQAETERALFLLAPEETQAGMLKAPLHLWLAQVASGD